MYVCCGFLSWPRVTVWTWALTISDKNVANGLWFQRGWLKMQDVIMTDQKWRQGVKWREKKVQFPQRQHYNELCRFLNPQHCNTLCIRDYLFLKNVNKCCKNMFCSSILHIIMKHIGSSRRITLIFDIFRIGVVTGYPGGKLNLYSVYSNVRRLCALLCPAISFLHFHVRHFHVLQFQRPLSEHMRFVYEFSPGFTADGTTSRSGTAKLGY